MSYRIAKSLDVLRNQINQAFPGRSQASDGWIGDAAHAATQSDHNPDTKGVVAALDVTHDPARGLDIAQLADRLAASRDPRIKYLIRNRQIMVPAAGWHWQPYTGSNPHTSHLHISVNATNYDDTRAWTGVAEPGKGGPAPAPAAAHRDIAPVMTKVIGPNGAVIRTGPGSKYPKSTNSNPATGILEKGVSFKAVGYADGEMVDYSHLTGRRSNKWVRSARGNYVSAVVLDINLALLEPPKPAPQPSPQPAPAPAPEPQPAPAPQQNPPDPYGDRFTVTALPGGGFEIYPLAEATVRSMETDDAMTVDDTKPLVVKYAGSFDGRVYYITEDNFGRQAALGFRADEFSTIPLAPAAPATEAGLVEETLRPTAKLSLRNRLVVLLAAIMTIFDKNKGLQ